MSPRNTCLTKQQSVNFSNTEKKKKLQIEQCTNNVQIGITVTIVIFLAFKKEIYKHAYC